MLILLVLIVSFVFVSLYSCSSNNQSIKKVGQVNKNINNHEKIWYNFIKLDKKTKIGLWEKNIDYILNTLEDKHYDMFHYSSYDEFYNKSEEIKSQLSKLSDFETFVKIRELVSIVHDGSTYVELNIDLDCFPFIFEKYSEGIYLTSTIEKYSEFLGLKLLEIENISIDKIIDNLSQIVSYDNEVERVSKSLSLIRYPDYLQYAVGGDRKDNYKFTFFDSITGKVKSINVDSKKQSDLKEINFINFFTFKNVKKPLCKKNIDENYWYVYNKIDHILYFQYNKTIEDKDFPLRVIYDEILNIINKENVKNLLIDLRNNNGKDAELLDPFIDRLIDNKKIINGNINIFIAIGKKTSFAGILNAIEIRNKLYGYLIGTQTGGSPNYYNSIKSFMLKEIGIKLYYPAEYYQMIDNDQMDSLWPDIVVKYNFKDIINGYDPVYEYIKTHF